MTASEPPSESFEVLLEKTSRTFALAIPYLPSPLRLQVTLSYLLFRIADTIEDASNYSIAEKSRQLDELADAIRESDDNRIRQLGENWRTHPPTTKSAELELLARAGEILAAIRTFDPLVAASILCHAIRTIEGMNEFVAMIQGLPDMRSLQAYCYVVAGIVGELLTELFLFNSPECRPSGSALRDRAAAFGQGLQLVNILKDASTDAAEGRHFLPKHVDRSLVFARAREDLEMAEEYVDILRRDGFPSGVVMFATLPVRLAKDTLRRVEQSGAGSKLSRHEVSLACRELEALITQ